MTARAISLMAETVVERSGGRCEALTDHGQRCPRRAQALHHRLPRAQARRGAEHLLDLAGDVDNIAHVCVECHTWGHAHPNAAQDTWLSGWWTSEPTRYGLVVPGRVLTGLDGHPAYVGGHADYQARYPTPVP